VATKEYLKLMLANIVGVSAGGGGADKVAKTGDSMSGNLDER